MQHVVKTFLLLEKKEYGRLAEENNNDNFDFVRELY